MKKVFLLLSLVFLLFSCTKKKEIYLDDTVAPNQISTPAPKDLSVIIKFPNFTPPLKSYTISSFFGERGQVVKGIGGEDGDLHKGLDMVPPSKDAQIYAVADGTVYIHYPPPGVKSKSGKIFRGHPVYGSLIILDHGNGIYTLYGHMKETWVHMGQVIKQGDPMGIVGSTGISTGVHLHFEIVFDPMKLLQESKEMEDKQ